MAIYDPGAASFWLAEAALLSGIGEMLLYMGNLSLRLVPLLLGAVFLAEVARIQLGEERLRRLLSGRSAWQGRFRAAALGGALPFCECGAFPVMLGLLRAGVPVGILLTFFLVSPVLSVPAFLLLLGFFGPLLAFSYLAMTTASAVAGSLALEWSGRRRHFFKEGFRPSDSDCGCSAGGSNPAPGEGSCGALSMQESAGCCAEPGRATGAQAARASQRAQPSQGAYSAWKQVLLEAWRSALATFRRVLPYAAAGLLLASVMATFIPPQAMERALSYGAPFDVLIAAAAGIPFYAGDCAMIAAVVPLITSTGAVGPGIAFIIAGAGTSINGLVFMNAVFTRRFLVLYVLIVFFIALTVGYTLALLA